MTGHDDALVRLAEHQGFETEWHDFMGRHRAVGLDTLRLLLRAEGIDTSNPQAALAHAIEAARRAPLPPRLTGTAGGHLRVPLSEDAPLTRAVPWRLEMADGTMHEGSATPVPDTASAGAVAMRHVLTVPLGPDAGEARLLLGGAVDATATVTIAPAMCFQGPLDHRRAWGLAAQIYGLRSEHSGGLGHYGALPSLLRAAARRGADAVALSPTHALFAADASHYSPYAPSSRTRMNGWLADPGGLPDVARVEELASLLGLEAAMSTAEAATDVDYRAAVPLRMALLRALFSRFAAHHADAGTPLGEAFRAFRAAGGSMLEDHARFEVLHAQHYQADPAKWDWRQWPAALRDPRSEAVADFAREHAAEVTFHVFLQFLSEHQLGHAQQVARDAGMGIGLVADLAVGTHAGGSRAWSRTAALLEGVSIGAPPDQLNTHGQDWGLTTFAPNRLVAQGYGPFIEDLRAATAHAGGVRIDHVMGLARIWCVPEGEKASHGAYMRFPAADMMRLLAAESHRSRAVVIGEDLGTLPDGYRDMLGQTGLFGMRVLFFERDSNGGFAPPDRYATKAAAMSSTHDMATLAGWWKGADIGLRGSLGLLAPEQPEAAEHEIRANERGALWHALQTHAGANGDVPEAPDERLGTAVARFLGGSASALVILPIEDAMLAEPQVNQPGTTDAHPNWRRRLPKPAEEMLMQAPADAILKALDTTRRQEPAS